jgi:hypothetical protein
VNREAIKNTLLGALKSATVWAAALLAALPDILPIVQQNFADVAPFIPASLHSRTLQVIALVMLLLRLKTNTSLANKGKQ